MMAEHGEPCSVSEANFCMNGGTCFKIPSVTTPTCVCSANYEGSRCEQFQLFSVSKSTEETGMIAAVVLISFLIIIVLCAVIYYIYKIKRSARSQPKPEEYLTVNSRA
ncbi:pro-neuregulin-4, membrane-bound isoform [Misgurnus anguillicaudatus]|uniref:pro-neuregulin-4, membrane-bound isoform n=1 Tax=Misgurnus anguillicaudatus TaxID=75329 RepID=UPI002435ADAB|nr:pro-neuregulin-4, membrane-bound isoform-like [Misgurnus anguillicaudatus]XP_055047812.1 pro-neuregulin-4, membrane-bound isoform-like [Misgurnus anguillicaudatus]